VLRWGFQGTGGGVGVGGRSIFQGMGGQGMVTGWGGECGAQKGRKTPHSKKKGI